MGEWAYVHEDKKDKKQNPPPPYVTTTHTQSSPSSSLHLGGAWPVRSSSLAASVHPPSSIPPSIFLPPTLPLSLAPPSPTLWQHDGVSHPRPAASRCPRPHHCPPPGRRSPVRRLRRWKCPSVRSRHLGPVHRGPPGRACSSRAARDIPVWTPRNSPDWRSLRIQAARHLEW